METNIDRVHEQVDRMIEKKYGHEYTTPIQDDDDFLSLKIKNRSKGSSWKQ